MPYYHVTERPHAEAILQDGFKGGWGDLGFGVYLYGNLESAETYAAEGGWDGRLNNPVILEVDDPSIEEISPWDLEPEWEAERYDDMHWRPMDPDVKEHWRPSSIAILDDTPAAQPV